MLKRISDGLQRISTGWVTLAALVVFALFVAFVLPAQSGGEGAGAEAEAAGSPDLSLWYTPAELYRMAEAYGEAGRQAYIRARFSFDVAWPLVYGAFLVTAISWLYARGFAAGSLWRRANLAPLLGVVLDFLENVSTSLVMARYPGRTPGIDVLAPVFTLVKWALVGGSFVLLVVGVVAAMQAQVRRARIGKGAAIGIVIGLWLVYTAIQTLSVVYKVDKSWSAIAGLVPGLLAVGALLAAGVPAETCYLRVRRPSWAGLGVLAAIAAFALAAVLPFGRWQGWNWAAALVYAPADGLAQELFFRAALLPALQMALKRERPWPALLLHSTLFGLWHIAPLFVGAPMWAVAAVMLVPFLCGIGWGWQVRRDGTVLWAMVQHSLIWVIGLQFPMVE